MRSEGRRIWSIKIGCATSSIKTSSFTLLMILRTFLTPLILIQQLTHYDSHTALRQYPTPHWVKSSDQVIFPFYPNFPWWVTVFRFITHFLFWFIIWFIMLFWKGTFWNFPMTHWWAIAYWSLECCLVVLHSPHVYKEAVLPQRKDNQIQDSISAQLFQQNLKLDNLDYSIRICHQFSSRSRPLWLHHRSVSILRQQS